MDNYTAEKIINPLTGRSIIDLTGQRFSRLVVISLDGVGVSGARWLCQCDCGNSTVVLSGNLRRGTSAATQSCGCASGGRVKDLLGRRFGKLVVVAFDGVRKQRAHWLCRCDCTRTKAISAGHLTQGHASSCGCGRLGVNNHAWNPDRDRLTDRHRAKGMLRDWRSAVYERDGYTCRACGVTGAELNAHHLDSWAAHPARRIYLDNGITLCVWCHEEFHSWMGGKHIPCTVDDYLEWATPDLDCTGS